VGDNPQHEAMFAKLRSGEEPEPLMLKFRIQVLRRMSKTEVLHKLREAVRRGIMPEGIEIHWCDWKKGAHGSLGRGTTGISSDRIPGRMLADLRRFYAALIKSDIRVERVRP